MKRKAKSNLVHHREHGLVQTDQREPAEGYLVGILECPLHKGFVEFEYRPGDLVSDLRTRIEEVWGTLKSSKAPYKRWFSLRPVGWAILCQDEDGAFVALNMNDRIPAKPPSGTSNIERSAFTLMLAGGIGRRSKAENSEAIHVLDIERSEYSETHLRLTGHRDYEIPQRDFNVRLIALLQLTGG